jgi:ribonuclease-3
LDRGLRQTKKFVYEIILSKNIGAYEDFKSSLNQWVMQNQRKLSYRVVKHIGPPHRRFFYVDLYIDNKKVSCGKGASKKEAEQEAAKKFLRKNIKRQIRNDK